MPSVLKTLLDNLSSKISVNTSDITEINNRLNDVGSGVTLEEYINTNNSNISKLQSDLQSAGTDISSIESDVAEISSGLTSVRSEVTTARGGKANLNTRLDGMDSKIETNTTEINNARDNYRSMDIRIAANGFTGFGRVLNTTAKQAWVSLSPDVHYYDVTGNETEQASAIYTIKKLSDIPILVTVSIANILTVTSTDLLPTSISSINIEGVLYSVYAIQLPNSTLIGNAVVQNSYVDSPVVFAPNANSITMSLIGNLGNMGSTVSSSEYNAYLPVLRPATSPGTVFKFLSTKIDPDTNTVQYSTFNSSITIPL